MINCILLTWERALISHNIQIRCTCNGVCTERAGLIPSDVLLASLKNGIRHPCVSDADLDAIMANDYLTLSLHYRQWHTNGQGGGAALKLRKRNGEESTAINLWKKETWPTVRRAADDMQLACIYNGDANRPLTLGELCGYPST